MWFLQGKSILLGAAVATALLLGGSGPAAAQVQPPGTVGGTVRSAEGTPLGSVQIMVEGGGRRLGGFTNADGRYMIPGVPPGAYTVTATMIGYGTAQREGVTVQSGAVTTADFELRTQVLGLAELVVTGVTEATSRAMIPFTVGRIGAADMPVPPQNAVAAIQGKVAGATVIPTTTPGGGVNILLRTPTSINRENAPLLVVDGVILSASSADISTLDIESIEVIKGAAAASLYGSRAAAGVVQIRTARGGALIEGRTRFSVRSEMGVNDIPNPIPFNRHHNFMLNEQGQFIRMDGGEPVVVERWEADVTPLRFLDQRYPGPVYNHINSLFDPGRYYTNSATFGYNSGVTSWLATASNSQETGVVRGNDGYNRTDIRLNLDHRIGGSVNLAISGFHMRSTRDELPGGTFFDFVQMAPDVNLLEPDPDGTRYAFQPDPGGIRVNPLYRIASQHLESRRLRTMANAELRYTPIAWASFYVQGSYDRSDRARFDWIPKGVKTPDYPIGNPGEAYRSSGITDGINAAIGMSVARDFFDQLATRTTFRAGLEREDDVFVAATGTDFAVGGIPRLNALRTQQVSGDEQYTRTSSYLVNSDIDWAQRYIFSGLIRRDGSSLFGPAERWHTYYRASAAYRMAEEPWWPLEQINEFRLRYSRGTAGGRPNFADQFEVFNILSGGGVSLATLGNRFLKPEHSLEQEVGVEMVALGRYALTLNYATQITRDQLVNVPLPSLFGFSSQWQNAGTVEGNTYEATFETLLVDRPGLRWSATLIGDRSRNTITEYDRPCHSVGLGLRCAGERIGTIYTQRFLSSPADLAAHRGGQHAGSENAFAVNDDGLLVAVGAGNDWTEGVAKSLWGTTVTVDGVNYNWGRPIVLLGDDGVRQQVRTGDSNPDFRWGFSNQVRWRGVHIYGLIDGQVGGSVYNSTKQRMYQWMRHGDEDQSGKPIERKKPDLYYSDLYNGNSDIDWFLEDGSFTRLRELSVRYSLDPSRIAPLARLNMDGILLSLIARNLYTWTGYSGYDPEIGSVLNRNDNFNYPRYRTLTGSVEITF
jgi:TonB-linked SusC/RagA family outer membrane protein